MKIHYFVTNFCLLTLQGSVSTHVRWSDSFSTHCSALIAITSSQIWWKFVNNF